MRQTPSHETDFFPILLSAIFLVSESLLKDVFFTQEFTRFEIMPLSILGCDQQNLENFLSDSE